MIASALRDGVRYLTPEEALAVALAAARRRLPVQRPAERMDGLTGLVVAVEPNGLRVVVTVELPDGSRVTEAAGFWHGRSSL